MFAALLTMTLACGGEAPPPPPAPSEDQASLADVLAGMQEGPPEPTPPSEGAPPPEPTGLTEAPPAEPEAPEATPTPVGSEACQEARGDRLRQEARVDQLRQSSVSRAERASVDAQASMNNCISDMDCAMDGKRIKELQDRVANSQRAYETALEQVGVLEAGFFEIDKRIRAACGG